MKTKNLPAEIQLNIIGSRNYSVGITSNLHRSKVYNLSSKLTTGRLGRRNLHLYTTTKTRYNDLISQIQTENTHKPTAYIEIVNQTTQEVVKLLTCTNFNIQSSLEDIMGAFSCSVILNTDVDVSVFESNLNNYINIYFGHNIAGTFRYVKIFTGLISRKSHTDYQYGKVNKINISGDNLSYILHKTSGIYSQGNFHGGSFDLVKMYLERSGLNHKINYTDPIKINQAITYKTALSGINTIKNLVPYCEILVDAEGVFIMREMSDPDDNAQIQSTEFIYNSSNMFNLKKEINTSKITTVVIVTGMDNSCSGQWDASDTDLAQYGTNQLTRNDNRIDTYTKAENLAMALLDIGQKYKYPVYAFDTTLNPYLIIGCIITVQDDTLDVPTLIRMRITEITHNYAHSKEHNTNIKCIKE